MITGLILCTTVYLVLIAIYAIGWARMGDWKSKKDFQSSTKVSVIIPARNEEEGIVACINSLINQEYPSELIELIVVNDNSTDRTEKLLDCFDEIKKINLSRAQGKKNALSAGIAAASGDFIITSDADCTAHKNWVKSLVEYYETEHPVMIAAPVKFSEPQSLLEKFQTLDFIGVQGVTGASNYWNISNMANGANLAFEKAVFQEVGGYSGNEHIASGDDFFLIDKVRKIYSDRVAYLKAAECTVYTKAEKNFENFKNQRIRWASKMKQNSDHRISGVLLFLLLFNLLLIGSLCYGIFVQPTILGWVFSFFIFKGLIDFCYLFHVAKFFGQRHLLWAFIPAQFLNYFYIIIIGIYSNFGNYQWKGRSLN